MKTSGWSLGMVLLAGCGFLFGSESEPEGVGVGECSDGADNDGNGWFDCDDPNCAGAPDCEATGGLLTGAATGVGTNTGGTNTGTNTGGTTTGGTTTGTNTGGTNTGTQTGTTTGAGTGTPTGTPTGTTTTATPPPGGWMHPVAVGFEVTGVLYADGTLNSVFLTDGTQVEPLLKVTFADAAFFGGGTQTGHFCEIYADISGLTPLPAGSEPFSNISGQPLNWSYETYPALHLEVPETRCGDVVDPAIWGTDGTLLIDAFDGLHFGFGFGQVSNRMWNVFGGSTASYNYDLVDRMFGTYIAVNDLDTHWSGCDWSYSLLYEVDAYDVQLEDPYNPGYLWPVSIAGVGSGPLPKGYVTTGAYWYQDFPVMSLTPSAPWDFTHLSDPPLAGTSDCGTW